jgi:hypothetical protein
MQRAEGLSAHLVVGYDGPIVWVAWFLNDRPLGLREFNDVGSALDFSDRMQFQNWSVGWRLVADRDDEPPMRA